ncbi:MAG TPA: hypothetical protein PLO25_00015 [Candidatus Saccharibacteria bacterium]|nr:hypothetical protein [Candidatus Saccharibacteria bacterium]
MELSKILDNRFNLWSEILVGKSSDGEIDPNSVEGVIFAAVREIAVFEVYKDLIQVNSDSILSSPLFRESYVKNYLYIQGIRIRKLTERGGEPIFSSKNTDIYSLGRLLDNMLGMIKSGELSRKSIATYLKIPTSKEEVERLVNNDVRIDLIFAKQEHDLIDGLCNEDGCISKESKVVMELKKRILPDQNKDLSAVNGIVNKLIAHSASTESRAELRQFSYDVKKIENVIQGLSESLIFLNLLIRRAGLTSVLPEGFDTCLVGLTEDDRKIAYAAINNVRTRVQQWHENVNNWTP